MAAIRNIVFIGDLLRTQRIDPYYADRSTRFLYELFRGPIENATGLPADFEIAREKKRVDRERLYRLAGYDCVSTGNWLRIASGEFKAEAADYLADCFPDCLLVGNECGALLGLMEARDLPHIDLRISPIRFLDDILFAFRTNRAPVADHIRRYLYHDEAIGHAAQRLKSYYVMRTPSGRIGRQAATYGFSPGTALLCGQTDVDLSLIRDGRLVNFSDCATTLERLVASHDHVAYKPHPMKAQANDNGEFLAAYPSIKQVNGNIYQMLCDDNLRTVAALSSSVLHEAPYFGKTALPLSHRYLDLAARDKPVTPGQYIMTRDAYFSSAFWADILSPLMDVQACPAVEAVERPNFLRSLMGMWWGYDLGRAAVDGGPRPLAAGRRLVEWLDPRGTIRRKLDPSGALRQSVKNFLGGDRPS